jgi:lactate dehydrogenase-like 2-hydroxyacid dehydrogenase
MKPLDVLMPVKGMDLIDEQISARLPLHRLWLEPNPDLWLAEWAPRIRALAMSGGHAHLDEAYMRQYPKLEIISSFGVGYDNIDAKAAAQLGIIVTNTPGVLDDEVADTTLGLMIMTVRQLPQAERYLRAGHWSAKGALRAFWGSGASARRLRPALAHSGLMSFITDGTPRRMSLIATILPSSTWPRPSTF